MGVIRQLGRISGALFLVALGGMAPFSVGDRAEKAAAEPSGNLRPSLLAIADEVIE